MPGEQMSQGLGSKRKQENPVELQEARWGAILEKIKHVLPRFSRHDVIFITEAVLSNSVRDGLRIIDLLGINRRDVMHIAGGFKFSAKQKEVADYLQLCDKKVNRGFANEFNFPGGVHEGNYSYNSNFLAENRRTDDLFLGAEAKEIIADLETYYAEFLKGQQVEAIKVLDYRSQGIQIGESFLVKLHAASSGMFYRGSVVDYIYSRLPKEAQKPELSKEEVIQEIAERQKISSAEIVGEILSNNLLKPADIFNLFLATGLKPVNVDILDVNIPELVKDAKYKMLNITAEAEEQESIKQLVKEIEESVKSRYPGMKLEKDRETNTWKFIKTGQEDKQEGPKKNLDTLDIKDFEKEELIYKPYTIPDFDFYGKDVWYATGQMDDVRVVGPDRKLSSSFRDIGCITAFPHGVAFIGFDKNNKEELVTKFEANDYTEWILPEGEIQSILNLNGRPVYILKKGDKEFIFDPLKKERKYFDEIRQVHVFNGELYYVAREGDTKFLIGPDGKEGLRCEDINWVGEWNGGLYLEAKVDGKRYFINTKNNLRGFPHEGKASDLLEVNGLYFWIEHAGDGNGKLVSFDHGKKNIIVDNAFSPQKINNKLFFAFRDNDDFRFFDVNGGAGRPYGDIHKALDICGNVYYRAEDGLRSSFIVGPGGKEIRDFGNVKKFEFKDGFVHIVAEKGGQFFHYYLEVGELEKGIAKSKKITDEDLTIEEKRKFLLLQAISNKDKVLVREYMNAYIQLEAKERRKVSVPRKFVDVANQALKEGQKFLLETIPGKRETKREAQMLAEYLFPEIQEEKFRGSGGREMNVRPENYFAGGRSVDEISDGDPKAKGQEVMRTREKIEGLIVSKLLAQYDKERGVFEHAVIPVNLELDEPVREYTFSIPNVYGVRDISLPFLLGAEIIGDRVKGITEEGLEIPLTPEILMTGGAKITLPPKTKGVVYSLRRSELPVAPEPMDKKDYESFKRNIEKRYGLQFSENIAPLPPELKLFVSSLEKLSPQEKIIEIEREVRRIGYYDFKNGQVQKEKTGMKPDELFSFMRERMDELKSSKKDMPENFNEKMFAGVCADFNKLVLSMLREAGIPSGFLLGFRPNSEIVTTAEAHGTAFILWPGKEDGKYRVIPVDGTPGGITDAEKKLLESIQQPSLEEKIIQKEQKTKELLKEVEKRFTQIEEMLAEYKIEDIRALSNGELEEIVNTILRYGVKRSHFYAIQGILNTAQYSPFNLSRINLDNPKERENFRIYLGKEIERERKNGEETQPGGSEFFSAIENFGKRNGPDSYRTLERIFDLIRSQLDPMEARAFIATVKYLDAKQMTKNKR